MSFPHRLSLRFLLILTLSWCIDNAFAPMHQDETQADNTHPTKNLEHIPKELFIFGLMDLLPKADIVAVKNCQPIYSVQSSSLPKASVLAKLHTSPKTGFRPTNVLDIGGGYSKQLPYLRHTGVDAYSLDPTYESRKRPPGSLVLNEARFIKREKDYVRDNRPWLYKGKVEDLGTRGVFRFSNMKAGRQRLKDGSFDIITSHRAWAYVGGMGLVPLALDPKKRKVLEKTASQAKVRGLQQVLRLLRSGGSARLHISEATGKRFLAENPPNQFGYDYAVIEMKMSPHCDARLNQYLEEVIHHPITFFAIFKK